MGGPGKRWRGAPPPSVPVGEVDRAGMGCRAASRPPDSNAQLFNNSVARVFGARECCNHAANAVSFGVSYRIGALAL